MELGGPWRAIVATEELRRTWLDDGGHHGWEPISVPGHWRNDDAFANNDDSLLYRTDFDHEGPTDADERWWLEFDGLFYQGDIWLDGAYVGDTEGYFFSHAFEVTEALAQRQEHTLGVDLTCTRPTDRTAKRNITGSFQHASYTDQTWNPGGIWRPVHLKRTGPVRIRHLRVLCRDASETTATVAFRAVLDAATAGEVSVRSAVGEVEQTETRRLAAGENQVEWVLTIDDPELWWPHALGDQPLHDVVVEVTPTEGDSPQLTPVSDKAHRRIGLRQVHLRAWVLHVNGERLFLKGANLGPSRQDLGEASPEDLRRDVALARDANLDLIRVHAHITRPEFYDAADEAGMVVWQDFPLHRGYGRSIRKQAQRQAREAVDLLAHHPCVAIWCAHDEPMAIDRDLAAGPEDSIAPAKYLAAQTVPSWNRTILDRSVKRALDKADGTRPVIAHSGVLPHPPQLDGTDSHFSFGWQHGDVRDLASLARTLPRLVRFVSQFGSQAVPDSDEFVDPDSWPGLDWDRLATHHGMQVGVFERRVPAADQPTLEAWRRATQQHQAELITRQVETLRRLKYRPTGGFALFCLADTHPAISSSVLDHLRRPKLGYRALAEACRPAIVVADQLPAEVSPGDALALDVHVVNDLRVPLEDLEITAHLHWSGGEQRWRYGGAVDADACARVATLQIEVPNRPGPIELTLTLAGSAVPGGRIERHDRSRIVLG